jgi:hypothetical protein
MKVPVLVPRLVCLAAVLLILKAARSDAPQGAVLKAALTFHAPFDGAADAEFARGDAKVYTGKELGKDGKPGLTTGNVVIARGKGRHGDALHFRKKEAADIVFFRGEKNIAHAPADWSGTVSLWLSLDPDQDLEPGYADPIQITERGWNDGALFVDFTRGDKPRHFRLGVFADRKVWDPNQREWEAVPVAERPMVDVGKRFFERGKWTHVAFTWSRFNSGKEDAVAKLYLDGQFQGALTGRKQTFTWDPARVAIQIGMSYVGFIDDLAIFDRVLSDAEIKELQGLEGGVKALRR